MPRYLLLFFMMSLCLCQVSCKKNTKESLNEEGVQFLQQGNYNGAIIHFKNALEKDPNFVDARFNLGQAYLETGKFEQAEREFQKVQLQSPSHDRVKLELARVANFQNKPAIAVPLLTSYLSEHKNDPAAMEQLALSAILSGDVQESNKYLQKVLEVDAARISARLALARNYISQGEYNIARDNINAVLAIDSKNKPALHALAKIEAQERDPEGMLDIYSRISSIDPSDLFARYKEGSILIDKGEGDKVKASAEVMIKDYPDKAEGHRLLGLYYLREGMYADSAASLQKSIRIQPDIETYYLLGMAQYYQGNAEQAINQFQTVIDYAPSFAPAKIMLAEILLKQGRGNEAVTVADKIIAASPKDFRGPVLKADALLLLGKPTDALSQYSDALVLAPNNYSLLVKSGLLKLSLGDAKGEDDLVKALKESPKGLDVRLALHSLYMRTGRGDEAMSVLNEGLSGSKSDAILFNALAKAALGRKDPSAAEGYLLKAREVDNTYLQTYYNLAAFKLSQGQVDDALAQYDVALSIKSDDLRSLASSALLLEKQGKIDDARSRLERARATGDTESSILLSRFLQQHGKSDDALAYMEQDISKKPEDKALVLAKAKLHVARKEVDKAMQLYGRLEAMDPWIGTMERTRAWMAMGDITNAEESARRLISLSPSKAQSYLPLATIQEVRKDRVGAESTLNKALALEPKNAQLGVVLAEFQLRGREADAAFKSFSKVLEYAPLNAQALTGKGMVMQFKGKKDEAAKLYLQAVQAQHDYVPALNNLAMLWAEDGATQQQALNFALAAFVRASSDASVIDTLGFVLVKNNRHDEALKVLERALSIAPNASAIRYHKALALAGLGKKEEAKVLLREVLSGGEFDEKRDAEALMKKL